MSEPYTHHLGDCLEIMKGLPDKSVDMILCDLPYGTTQCKWDTTIPFDALWEQYKRVIKPNGAVVLFGAEPFASKLRLSNLPMYRYDWIWRKNKATQHLNANRMPLLDYETISVFYASLPEYHPVMGTGKAYSNSHKPGDAGECYGKVGYSSVENRTTRYPRRVIDFPVDIKAAYHPTQKPVLLLEYLISTYTSTGQVVLDNTMGSGSTGVACANTGRRFMGIELDPGYFLTAKGRVESAFSDIAA